MSTERKCGECKDYQPMGSAGIGWCEGWKKALWFRLSIDPDKTPLENLKGQSRIVYWLARNFFWLSDSACFRSKEEVVKKISPKP